MVTENKTRAAVLFLALLILVPLGGCTASRRDMPSSRPDISVIQALSELEALDAPPGVEAGIFEQIRASLRSQLLSKAAGKMASAPPLGMDNAVDDLVIVDDGGGFFTAAWSYHNVGDYNQDGIVNVADITPLAQNFLQNATPGNEWVDGNEDNVINISDVTPLAMHFLSECDHYHIMQGETETGAFAEVGSASFASATGSDRKQFSVGTLALTAGWWYMAQPMDSGGNPGEPGVPVQIPAGNQPPVASFTANPLSGPAPLTVSFDASASTDPDGTIVSYEWDWDGDGVYDESYATPIAEHIFTSSGAYEVHLCVTDDSSGTGTMSVTINVVEEWIHSWGLAGWDLSEAVAVNSSGEVYVATCLEISGTDSDIGIVKYSPQGVLLWQKVWGGEFYEEALGMVTNSFGELLVIGQTTTYGEGNADLLLLKFSSSGQLLWARTWGSPDQEMPVGIGLDSNEDLIVAGNTDGFGATTADIFVAKILGANANVEWSKLWGSAMNDYASGVIAAGTSFSVSGTTYGYGQGGSDALVISGSTDGTMLWRKTWGTSLSEGARAITIEPITGHLCVTGFVEDVPTFSLDVLLLEYMQNGDLLLERKWGGGDYDRGNTVIALEGGDIIVGGYTKSFLDPVNADGYLLRYSTAGDLLWSRTLSGTLGEDITAGCLDGAGNLLLAGYAPDKQCVWSDITGTETATSATESVSLTNEFTDIVGAVNDIPFDARDVTGTEDTGGGGDADGLAIKLSPFNL